MFSKANIVSTIICAIWGMGGGFLLWGILADPFMTDHVVTQGIMKVEPDFPILAVGTLIQAFGFSTIYRKYGASNYGAGSGISMGIVTAIMIGAGEKLIDFATANIMDLQGTLINFIVYLVFFGITGLLAGIIYKKLA